jgi:hypothetical protein
MSRWQNERTGGGLAMMEHEDRRSYRRVALRLPVTGLGGPAGGADPPAFYTANVSAGGMFLYVPPEAAPEPGGAIHFELTVPPGDGYSTAPCCVRGRGRVLRAEPEEAGRYGVAVQFTERLSLGL